MPIPRQNDRLRCEDERIITEEPSVLGFPDYYTFRNNNDDQTAFSLLFKTHGFRPFPQSVRDDFVLAARNIAKFIQASDAFALGQEVTQDGSAGKQCRDRRAELSWLWGGRGFSTGTLRDIQGPYTTVHHLNKVLTSLRTPRIPFSNPLQYRLGGTCKRQMPRLRGRSRPPGSGCLCAFRARNLGWGCIST